MLLPPHNFSDIDRACDAAVRIVREHGVAALSVRAIARDLQITAPALTQRWENRARLIGLVVSFIGDRWLHWASSRWRRDGIRGLLPRTPEEIQDTRVWAGVSDLGRSDPDLALRVADIVDRERGLVRVTLQHGRDVRVPASEVHLVHGAVEGLRNRMIALAEPLEVADALAALDRLLGPPQDAGA